MGKERKAMLIDTRMMPYATEKEDAQERMIRLGFAIDEAARAGEDALIDWLDAQDDIEYRADRYGQFKGAAITCPGAAVVTVYADKAIVSMRLAYDDVTADVAPKAAQALYALLWRNFINFNRGRYTEAKAA